MLFVHVGAQSFRFVRLMRARDIPPRRSVTPVGQVAGIGPIESKVLPGLSEEEYERAGKLVRRLWRAAEGHLGTVVVPALAVRHRRLLTMLAESLCQLPSLRVAPSDGPAGREVGRLLLGLQERPGSACCSPSVRARLGAQLLLVPDRRSAVGVLAIPADPACYLVGRKRHALRNNLSHARDLGVVAREVTDGATQLDYVEQVLAARNDGWLDQHRAWLVRAVDNGLVRMFAGYGPDGTVLTVMLVVVDPPWGLLCLSVSVDGELASSSRYATHAFMVEALSRSGVRSLVGDSVLALTPGLRYYQARLGFDLANLAVG